MGIPMSIKLEFGRSTIVTVAIAAITVMQCFRVLTPEVMGLITVLTGGVVTLKTQEERKTNGDAKEVALAEAKNGCTKVGNITVSGRGQQ